MLYMEDVIKRPDKTRLHISRREVFREKSGSQWSRKFRKKSINRRIHWLGSLTAPPAGNTYYIALYPE